MTAVVHAVQHLALSNDISSLPDDLSEIIGEVKEGDYDAMYKAVGEVITFFPAHLHEKLYAVAAEAVAGVSVPGAEEHGDRESDREAIREQPMSTGERSSGGNDTMRDLNENDQDDETLAKSLSASISTVLNRYRRGKRKQGQASREMTHVHENVRVAVSASDSRNTEEQDVEFTFNGDQDGVLDSEIDYDSEEDITVHQRRLDTVIDGNTEHVSASPSIGDASSRTLEGECLEELIAKITEDEGRILAARKSQAQPKRGLRHPSWASLICEKDGFISPTDGNSEESLLSLAGALPFEQFPRRYGTPYFSDPPLVDPSNKTHGETPSSNGDVTQNEDLGIPTREVLLSAYLGSGGGRGWRCSERNSLRGAVAVAITFWERCESDGESGDADSPREAADENGSANASERYDKVMRVQRTVEKWGDIEWERLVTQHGAKFGRREANDVMCRYLNAEAPWLTRAGVKWDPDEDAVLLSSVSKALDVPESGGWRAVAETLGKRRGVMEIIRRWYSVRHEATQKTKPSRPWTAREDRLLCRAVETIGVGRWAHIALVAGGGIRNGPQCMHRWTKRLSRGGQTGRWDKEEEERLRDAVERVGQVWVEVAKQVRTRTDVQCREKWLHNMKPNLNHGKWSTEEDARLRKLVAESNVIKWSRVAEKLGRRTPVQCQKRWQRLCKYDAEKSSSRKRRCPSSGESAPRAKKASCGSAK